jgi:hypothetical protein
MTLATLILDSLFAGFLLIAVGWTFDLLQARSRHRATRLRACDSATFYTWDRAPHGPHFPHATARDGRSTWAR